MKPTGVWARPGPERTLRPSVVVALRRSRGVGFQVTARPARLPWVCTWAADTQPSTVAPKRISYQPAVAASLPRMLYFTVEPAVIEPTLAWAAPGPARTLRL